MGTTWLFQKLNCIYTCIDQCGSIRHQTIGRLNCNLIVWTPVWSTIQTGTVGFGVHCAHARPPGAIAADYSRLPSATPGHHRDLRDLTRVWRQRYQIMVVQALTEQIPEPIMFWFVIFGFVAKCVIHCMFDGMQDSSISTKTWSCKIDWLV